MKWLAFIFLPSLLFAQDVDFGPPYDPLRDSKPLDYWLVSAIYTSVGPHVQPNKSPARTLEQRRPTSATQLDPGGFGGILNRAQWVWDVLSSNRPLVTTDFEKYAEALPKTASNAMELTGWEKPILVQVRTHALNRAQIRVATVVYAIQFSYGGRFKGRGRYLANVVVVPQRISVVPGFHVDLKAQVMAVLNFGTARNPIAVIQLLIIEKVSSMLADKTDTRSFLIRGDGKFSELTPSDRKFIEMR